MPCSSTTRCTRRLRSKAAAISSRDITSSPMFSACRARGVSGRLVMVLPPRPEPARAALPFLRDRTQGMFHHTTDHAGRSMTGGRLAGGSERWLWLRIRATCYRPQAAMSAPVSSLILRTTSPCEAVDVTPFSSDFRIYGAICRSCTANVARLLPSNAAFALSVRRISSFVLGVPLIAISIIDNKLIYHRLCVNKKARFFAL